MSVHTGHQLFDFAGNDIGEITDVLSEPKTLEPEFYVVKPGLFRKEHLVPVELVHARDEEVAVVDRHEETVRTAPMPPDHAGVSLKEREELAHHYGIPVTVA